MKEWVTSKRSPPSGYFSLRSLKKDLTRSRPESRVSAPPSIRAVSSEFQSGFSQSWSMV